MTALRNWRVRPAHGAPLATVQLRARPEDFRVDEVLGFEPSGAGEHLLLHIEKRGLTTEQAVKALARAWGLRARNIGHAGMKDRLAVTRQHLSVPWPMKDPLPTSPTVDGLSVLAMQRHHRKLRPGSHAGNRFELVCRLADGAAPALTDSALQARVAAIRAVGCPNAFGSQRFGRDGDNAEQFMALPAGRRMPGILLSAARSLVFNAVLDHRIADGSWCTGLDGDWLGLDGSRSGFAAPAIDAAIAQRLSDLDVHPTGPLPGQGPTVVSGPAAAVEEAVTRRFEAVVERLCAQGLAADRRPLRVPVRDLDADQQDDAVVLRFSLPPGAYATSVVDQLFEVAAPA